MNTVRLRAASSHVPAGQAITDFWRTHHQSLLDAQFKRSSLIGKLQWVDVEALIEAQLSTNNATTEDDLLSLANAAILSAQFAAFRIVEGSITTAITGWPVGGAMGFLTGSQIARNGPPLARLAVMLLVGAVGAAVSSRIRAEIPIFKLVPQAGSGLVWERVPIGTAVPSNFAFA